ncbi:MAG: zinc metalloprotease HtpX [Candidatus Limnocylindrales bacterium]
MNAPARQTFYAQIAANKRQSVVLAFIVILILGLLGFAIGYGLTGSTAASVPILIGVVVVSALLAIGSYFGGDSLVLASSQAREVSEADAPQLLNVVQELAIAANVPMPRVYIIDDSAPNAFATGRDPQHASVAVTSGLLEKLDREELQGVIGHEMSHVRNYDIRFTLLVGVMVGSVALLSQVFLRFTFWGGGRSRSRDSGGGGLQIVFLVLALVLAVVAPIAASLVQLAVSRQREYLADASSVDLTRDPQGLERALLKISGDPDALEVANGATQHLYIVNPIKKFTMGSHGLFSTHPPIVDRVNRLRALTGEAPLDAADPRLASLD